MGNTLESYYCIDFEQNDYILGEVSTLDSSVVIL